MRKLLWSVAGLSIVIIGAASLSALSRASSDAAWKELADKAGTACMKASGFDEPAIAWSSLDYRDDAALLVTGIWPQAHMNGARGAMLCLYDKAAGSTEINEFDLALLR